MLQVFDEFREKLDELILKAFGHRVVLWGYGYSGRFIAWYAEYYHSIKVDYIIEDNWERSMPYEFPLFRSSIFDFGYKDVKDAIVWLTIPEDNNILNKLNGGGYLKGETWFNFGEFIFGKDHINLAIESDNPFERKKTGIRDVQFMEWLEYKYDCNFVTAIEKSDYEEGREDGAPYRISAQKEIFSILDKCHCVPQKEDAIFDFGCGKGGGMISFLDYGFQKVGGVEYEKKIYDVMISNFEKLGIDIVNNESVQCIYGDAAKLEEELDIYNWFYFFDPFNVVVYKKVIDNICDSIQRRPRKVRVININPKCYYLFLQTGYFRLTNQFLVSTRQKVVDIFETKISRVSIKD